MATFFSAEVGEVFQMPEEQDSHNFSTLVVGKGHVSLSCPCHSWWCSQEWKSAGLTVGHFTIVWTQAFFALKLLTCGQAFLFFNLFPTLSFWKSFWMSVDIDTICYLLSISLKSSAIFNLRPSHHWSLSESFPPLTHWASLPSARRNRWPFATNASPLACGQHQQMISAFLLAKGPASLGAGA